MADAPPTRGRLARSEFLRFERHGVLAHLTVDRPEARNALTLSMASGSATRLTM